jgi:hypothetical protein
MKFQNTFCSQCGGEFGPGDHGYSHCKNHSNARINVEFVYPPIPVRVFDFCATFEGYEPNDPIGYGETEQEATQALLDAADVELV